MFPNTQREGKIDLRKFGQAMSGLMFDAPIFSPMLGPMSYVPKEKKRNEESAESAQAKKAIRPPKDNLIQKDLSTTESIEKSEGQNANRSNLIYEQLRNLEASRRNDLITTNVELEDVDGIVQRPLIRLIPTLFDGWSYTQTVENLFYFSYLVKQGLAGIFMEKKGNANEATEPLIALYTPEESIRSEIMLDTITDPDDIASTNMQAANRSRQRTLIPALKQNVGSSNSINLLSRQFIMHIDVESWENICKNWNLQGQNYQPPLYHYRSSDSKAPEGYAYYTDIAP
jgi:Nse4 C-terminal